MFDKSKKTTNVPTMYSTESSSTASRLLALLESKKKYISVLKHLTSIPHSEELPKNIYTPANDCITSCIDKLNELTCSIIEIKNDVISRNGLVAYEYQIDVIMNILSGGHYFDYNMKRSDIEYDHGLIQSLRRRKTFTVSDASDDEDTISSTPIFDIFQEKYFATASDIFCSPKDLHGLMSDPRIKTIANEIYAFVENCKPLAFIQVSPFLKELYLNCIKALVICVPYHDMANFNIYYRHFENVNTLVEHVRYLFTETFKQNYVFTEDEWLFDPSIGRSKVQDVKSPPIKFDDSTIDDIDLSCFHYPHVDYKYEVDDSVGKYDIFMVMNQIYGVICELYERHM